ncbi:hypothetical protein [Parafrankia sp. EUN1f]|uniref:hypothetical protein n=1 Tax=Parafrankia sp. EUN1f TaxID=102897 RepID=UPI0001C46D1D|nr:hypothetical protein [Parafrankia sp. EUN1f]EFC80075.1 hypothetical protein FrEUN1fDRAFT_6802 [Parafrankia sp. EUN1f]
MTFTIDVGAVTPGPHTLASASGRYRDLQTVAAVRARLAEHQVKTAAQLNQDVTAGELFMAAVDVRLLVAHERAAAARIAELEAAVPGQTGGAG